MASDVTSTLSQVEDAKIDESGKFKYILIKVSVPPEKGTTEKEEDGDSSSKVVVRGRADCPYHGDVFDKFLEETSKLRGIRGDILGGGRIQRADNKILVYGYSQGYGKADHSVTVEILKRKFPSLDISWNDEGY